MAASGLTGALNSAAMMEEPLVRVDVLRVPAAIAVSGAKPFSRDWS